MFETYFKCYSKETSIYLKQLLSYICRLKLRSINEYLAVERDSNVQVKIKFKITNCKQKIIVLNMRLLFVLVMITLI